MKIAVFHELNKGGARRAVNEFSRCLKKENIVDLYFIDDKENEKEKRFFSNVFFLKFIPRVWNGGNWRAKLYKDSVELLKLYKVHKRIAGIIDSKNYDLVFVHGSKYTQAPFLLSLVKTKKIYYCQEPLRMVYEGIMDNTSSLGFFKKRYERLNRLLRKTLDKNNIFNADLVLANSKYTQKNIKKAYGIDSKVYYMGVDEKVFFPSSAVKKTTDILFIGAYEFIDGYDLLKNALELLKEKINAKVLASEVKWIDSDITLRRIYLRSKVALCLAYNEPFGLIPLEAMACGVPVIAVNEGGYKETVINGLSGYLIDRDPKALVAKIRLLLGNHERLSKLRKDTRGYINSNWTWDGQSDKLNILFKKHAKS